MIVAPRLTALREALGMTKADFSDMIEIDRSSYTKIEKGEKPLLPRQAFKIYERFGVDMNYIYLGQVGGVPQKLSKTLTTILNTLH
ncbi:helix-turn-helix domain-containing protein [Phaeobacter inhibens]|uniref:helix-turn-helix domain-containing protein n=1 Tax=Phaeobacter inhibens TaxID=221822 RepID=UPI00295ED7EF|nr:helix-turn-helix transcriptional regulator [Phaeobacter inhibens]